MYYSDSIEKSLEGLLRIIEVVKDYEKDEEARFIDGVKKRGFDENKIQQMICIVRQRLNMSRRELLSLAEFALTFEKLWATDDNDRFHNVQRMFYSIRSTLKGTKIIYKKFSPIVRKQQKEIDFRPSVFVKSTLANASCGRDLYGIDSYSDSVKTLYAEMGAFFTNVVAVLVLCHEEIKKEAEIRKNPERCLELLTNQCNDILKDMKDVIGLFSIEKVSDSELQRRREKAGSLKKFAQEGLHKYNIAEIKKFAILQAIESGAEDGLEGLESLYFPKNHSKGLLAKDIAIHFDIYAKKGRGKLMDTASMVEYCCWTGIDLKKAYNLLKTYYHGQYTLPQEKSVWARLNELKKSKNNNETEDDIIQRQASDFQTKIDCQQKQKKEETAQTVPLYDNASSF